MRHRRVLGKRREVGSVLVIALLLMVLLSLLGVTLLTVAGMEHSVAFNALWSEGALMAADAGINRGINQITTDPDTSIRRFPDCGSCSTTIATGYTYRSGPKTAAGPTEPQFVGEGCPAGFDCSKWHFFDYEIEATGTGPRNAVREVEARVRYGPVQY
jgi:Tfp pilus assembly protein PilX